MCHTWTTPEYTSAASTAAVDNCTHCDAISVRRRSYRSARQLGRRGVAGIVVLRLASVASAGSIHLLCGAGRVPFMTYLAGTAIGLTPAMIALCGVGALVRRALLHPSLENVAMIGAAAVLLSVLATGLRTALLVRQFSPSTSHQRRRAEFG